MEELSQMIEALGLEVATIREKRGGAKIELRGGECVGKPLGAWLYKFMVSEELNLRDETPVRVTAGQEDVAGFLVSYRDGVLLVSLESDLGPQVATARLIADDAFLIERLQEILQKVHSGEIQFNRVSSEQVFCRGELHTADAEPLPEVTEDGTLNKEQISAIRRSLGSDVTFVWGPPGTGKTTTLARIVEAHYRAGRAVLLVSNTNIAVDTALERVADRLKDETDFHQGLVIRQGPVVKEELRQRFGPQITLEEIVARLGAPLVKEQEELTLNAESLTREKKHLKRACEHFERLNRARAALASRSAEKEIATAKLTARQREAKASQAKVAHLRTELDRALSMNPLRRFFSGIKQEKIEREISKEEMSVSAAMQASAVITKRLPELEEQIAKLRAEVTRLISETNNNPPAEDILKRLGEIESRLEQILERRNAIRQQLEGMEREILSNCKILATTVYRTYLSKNGARQFDVVVIDEASMLMPPLVYYVAGLATQSVTVAGDFRQLPPIVMSREGLAEKWLKCDVFEKAGIPEQLEQNEPIPHLIALRTQYRMREPICSVINNLFYNDRPLRSDPSVNHINESFPLSNEPLLYIDTSSFNPWAAFRVGTFSRYNLLHALLVRNIVLHLAETGYLPATGEVNDAIGIVSPYACQAQLIQALLADRLGARAAGIAATVHRFQGNEKKAMIIDLTDSLGAPLGRFLKAVKKNEDGARLLNVAASRAKQHLILIGNFKYLREKAPQDGSVRRLIDHFTEKGKRIDLDTLLPLAERDWIDGLHRILPATFDFPEGASGAFTEGTFFPAFLKDITSATESIVIFSPFATSNGTARWVDPLRVAIKRGVCVRILSRPANEFGGGATEEVSTLVGGLRRLGVNVDLRNKMHEKIAIVDGRILWHGSLNILSHRDTHESMLRIESSAACQHLFRLVSSPRGRGREMPMLFTPENPPCPQCGGPTVWNTGRSGIWFKCENETCNGTINLDGHRTRRKPQTERNSRTAQQPVQTRPCPEPGCNGRLVLKQGRFGPFLGCTNYPGGCRHSENLNKN